MHDVLAHKVSLIALQAGGLEVNPGVGTEQVQQTAGLIRATAREALQDLRGVLGVLRDNRQRRPTAPTWRRNPGCRRSPALVAASRAAGVRVQLANDVTELPDTLGRTVYRVVQEGLTNVHKHARGAATDIGILRATAYGTPGVRSVGQQSATGGGRLAAAGFGCRADRAAGTGRTGRRHADGGADTRRRVAGGGLAA